MSAGHGTHRSGRRPKPLALIKLQGSRVRAKHKAAPTYRAEAPPMPAHLERDEVAKAKWDLLVERLLPTGVLTIAHGEALAVLCETWADYLRCRDQFEKMHRTMVVIEERKLPDGTIQRRVRENPLVRRSERLAMLLQRYLGEFGLTPMTQSKVQGVPEVQDVDPLESLLKVVR